MKKVFLNYMKRELVKYIRFELDKGYTLDEIKSALFEGGHNQTLIDEAISALEKNSYSLEAALEEPIGNQNLHDYLVHDIETALMRYVKLQLDKGYKIEEIRDILLNYGHTTELVETVIAQISKKHGIKATSEQITEKKQKNTESLGKMMRLSIVVVSLFSLIILLFFTAASANESLGSVIAGFLPLIVYFLVLLVFIRSIEPNKRQILLYLPIVFAVAFFVAGIYNIFGQVQYQKLFFINIVFSYILAYFFLKIEPKKEKILKAQGEISI